PLGNTIDEFWTNLLNGVSGAATITRFDPTNFKTKFACEVKNFNPLAYFDRKEAKKLDMFAQFAVIAAEQAVNDAKFDLETIDHDRVGVVWGDGIGGLNTFLEEVKGYVEGGSIPRFNPFFIPKMIADIAA